MTTLHPTTQYAEDIINGVIPSCELVKASCQRHLMDLIRSEVGDPEFPYVFSEDHANMVIDFFHTFLHHSKGEWAGQSFVLGLWQAFIVGSLFGWIHKTTKFRRFRTAYIQVARKNGKTTLVSGIGLYMFGFDGEQGAECYVAAALDVSTPMFTEEGWSTVGAIEIGDYVFGDDGGLCRVNYITPVMYNHKCYKVKFDDNSTLVADAGHLWETEAFELCGSNKGSIRRPKLYRCNSRNKAMFSLHNKSYRVCDWDDPYRQMKFDRKLDGLLAKYPLRETRVAIRTTQQLYETQRCKNPARLSNHTVKLAGALTLPDQDLPLHPYVLGVWLGDGRANRGSITLHPDDIEIVNYINQLGYPTSRMPHDQELLRITILDIRKYFRRMGLLDNKHIPKQYLMGSEWQRLELLRGLMDTDGTCTKTGECRFNNSVPNLSTGVYHLVASLGLKPNFNVKATTHKPTYIVSFMPYRENVRVFNLPRKANRQQVSPPKGTQCLKRYIREITLIDPVPVKCIEVDNKSHLFLVGESLIPTHNTKRDQARIAHSEAIRMVKASPYLKEMIGIFKDNLHITDTASKFEPLGADANTMDGLNIHCGILDEAHAHKTPDTKNVIETATGSRRQSLLAIITTSGFDRDSMCYEQFDYTRRILNRTVVDETYFGIVFTIDIPETTVDGADKTKEEEEEAGTADDPPQTSKGDIWYDESVWIKANPNLGISVKLDDLQRKCAKAREIPSEQNNFLTKHLNVWTQQFSRWISLELWDENNLEATNEDTLRGRLCVGGIDLSSVSDLTCWVMAFPSDQQYGRLDIVMRCWCPEAKLYDARNRYKEQYQAWERSGWLKVTEGSAIDYEFVRRQILEDTRKFNVESIAVDRLFQGYEFAQKLNEDMGGYEKEPKVVSCGMGYLSMAGPCNEFEKRLLKRHLNHGGNPVLRFMADSVAASTDPAGNKKPNKDKSQGKIDGIVGILLCLDRLLRGVGEGTSVYDSVGIRSVR